MKAPITRYTDALRDGATVEARMAAAYRDGQATAAAGSPGPCPFDGDARSAIERVCAVAWVRGYGAGNPMSDPTEGA